MNRNFKRVLAGIAALTMCAGLIPSSVFSSDAVLNVTAADDEGTITYYGYETIEYKQLGETDINYKVEDDTLYIEGRVENTEIPYLTFANNNMFSEEVTNVVIGKNITGIGVCAFQSSDKIQSVTLPEGLKTISGFAFAYLPNLTEIVIPKSVISLASDAFSWAGEQKKDIYTAATPIDSIVECFTGSTVELHIPQKNMVFWQKRFGWGNDQYSGEVSCGYVTLKEAEFEDTDGCFEQFGDTDVFYKIEGETMTVDGAVLSSKIPDNFYELINGYHDDVCNLVIGDKIVEIGSNAFSSWENLESVEFPDTLLKIGDSAFANDNKLYDIDIPENVTSIGSNAFGGSGDSKKVIYTAAKPDYVNKECFTGSSVTLYVPSKNFGFWQAAFGWAPDKFSDNIGSGIIELEKGDFAETIEGFTRLGESNAFYKVEDNTMTVVGAVENTEIPDAFEGGIRFPEDVTKVVIGENISSIGLNAFSGCKNLESVTFSDEVKAIGPYAFNLDDKLTSITLPEGLVSLGEGAFGWCFNINKNIYTKAMPDDAALTCFNGSTVCLYVPSENIGFWQEHFGWKNDQFSGEVDWGNVTLKEYEFEEKTETGKFGDYVKGIGFTLDGKIGVNLQTNENAEDFTVTCEGKTIPVIATKNGISFYIAPKEMVKEYTIEVNGTSKTITPVDIVALYTADDAKPELAEYADLAQSLADYCKAADAYFDGDETTKIELPADYEGWDTEDLEYLEENYKDKVSDDGNIYKTSLVLNSETAFKIYVSNPEGITVDEVNADEGVKTQIDKNTVCVKISNLGPAKAMNNSFTVNGGTFTVGGYLLKAFTQTDDEELVKLCSLYGDYIGCAYDFDLED